MIVIGPTLTSLLKSRIPYYWFLNAAFACTLVVASILLFIGVFLHDRQKLQQKKQQFRIAFSDLLAQVIISETVEELQDALKQFLSMNNKLLSNAFARKILIREIVKSKDSISGKAAENLLWLYEELQLDKDSLQRFSSGKWHQKASAIQQLAEMQQNKYLVKIYRETNSKNTLIRTEAQIAVVKLTGFKGLRFLNIVSQPISQWQQLSLISQLQEQEIEPEKIKTWLRLKNESVVEFALRLVEVYKCFDLHDDAVACLQHASLAIRLQALKAVKEICNHNTTQVLLQHFQHTTKPEQLTILDMLVETGTGNSELEFLTSLLQHNDEAIRFAAMRALQEISPAWPVAMSKEPENDSSFTYPLSSIQKKAV